ncbi:hypothetical protein ONZ45_g19210 [Pleurotus djamor]|nr:hypothetical protein ONZ45_g19210 [Pleurotus djamor]
MSTTKTTKSTSWLGFVTSQPYRASPSSINSALKEIAKEAGAVDVYHGIQHEDDEYGYLIPVWENSDARTTFRANKAVFESVIKKLEDEAGMSGDVVGVDFVGGDAKAVFEAPITEIVCMELKDGESKDQVAAILTELVGLEGDGYLGGTWGATDRADGQLIMAVGWESLEAHRANVTAGREDVDGLLSSLKSLTAKMTVNHSRLVKV